MCARRGELGTGEVVDLAVQWSASTGAVGRIVRHSVAYSLCPSYRLVPGLAEGYSLPDSNSLPFMLFAGAEVGDTCEFDSASASQDALLGNAVQRTWSNASASRGNPGMCEPLTGTRSSVARPRGASASIGRRGRTGRRST